MRNAFYEHDGIPVYRYPIPNESTRAECQGTVVVRGAERLHTWLKQQCPDVVHFHSFVAGLGLPEGEAAKTTGTRVVATNHLGSLGFICQRCTLMRWGEKLCDGICRPTKCAACELQNRGLSKPLAWIIGLLPPPVGWITRVLPRKLGTGLSIRRLIVHNQTRQREILETVDKFVLLTQ
jgi:glycosyl transferase family 4